RVFCGIDNDFEHRQSAPPGLGLREGHARARSGHRAGRVLSCERPAAAAATGIPTTPALSGTARRAWPREFGGTGRPSDCTPLTSLRALHTRHSPWGGGRGDDMRAEFLPLSRPSIGDAEIEAVVSCLRSGWVRDGRRVRAFEQAF